MYFHSFRHYLCTRLHRLNLPAHVIQEFFQWSSADVSYWFPEDHTVWFKPGDVESSLDYKLFTYEVENDEVTVSDPTDVKLTVAISDVNSEIASKDEKIATL